MIRLRQTFNRFDLILQPFDLFINALVGFSTSEKHFFLDIEQITLRPSVVCVGSYQLAFVFNDPKFRFDFLFG